MRPEPCLTVMPIVRSPIPQEGLLRDFLARGCRIAGGFALWLVGGCDTYSDIDVYADDWTLFYDLHSELREKTSDVRHTPHTSVFVIDGIEIQLVKPGFRLFSDIEFMSSTDMTATAIMLRLVDGHFEVVALYPDDIKLRTSHLLLKGDWTWYRIEQMERKGYTVIQEGAITV